MYKHILGQNPEHAEIQQGHKGGDRIVCVYVCVCVYIRVVYISNMRHRLYCKKKEERQSKTTAGNLMFILMNEEQH